MTTVLVVHHDPDIADQEVDSLRRAGYIVRQCAGPTVGPCPVLQRRPCPAVDEADVLVYDVWSAGDSDSGRHLIEELREQHPEIPVVLTAPGIELDWVETSGVHAVVPLVGLPTGARLQAAVEKALASVPEARSRSVPPQPSASPLLRAADAVGAPLTEVASGARSGGWLRMGIALSVAALLVLGAVYSGMLLAGEQPAGGLRQIVIEDMRYVPNRLDVTAGDTITLQVVNRGSVQHDVNFASLP
jgi:DNA-binding response OmpR family regulator